MLRFWILAGYFYSMSHLQATGRIDQYINPHYQYLTKLTMGVSLVLAIVQLFSWVKEDTKQLSHSLDSCNHCEHTSQSKISRGFGYILIIVPIFAILLLPTVSLDATIVDAKGFHFPISKDSTSFGDIEQQYVKPNTKIFFNDEDYDKMIKKELKEYLPQESIVITDDNYLKVMELIYDVPKQFVGKQVKFKGFVYNDPVEKKENLFVFRFGVLHCVADSGVFGLMIQTDKLDKTYLNNEWVQVEGEIDTEFYTPFNQYIPVIHPTSIQKVGKPKNEYVYREFE